MGNKRNLRRPLRQSARRSQNDVLGQLVILASHNCDVLKRILTRLSRSELSNIRRVSNTLREAVNRTVWGLRFGWQGSFPATELADTFPNVDRLHVSLLYSSRKNRPAFHDTPDVLSSIMKSSPMLLTKLRTVNIKSQTNNLQDLVAELTPFLIRCTHLQELHIQTPTLALHFNGLGSTPDAQRTSMQQQLSAALTSPSPLSSPSWPLLTCLTSLTLNCTLPPATRPPLPRPAPFLLSLALQTSSLLDLTLTLSTAVPSTDLPLLAPLSSLTRLTHLDLTINTPLALLTSSRDPPLTLPDTLPSCTTLQCLQITSTIPITITGDWTPLARLARLQLRRARLPLDALWLPASLIELRLPDSTATGGLASLFRLPDLTVLEGPRHVTDASGEGGSASAGHSTRLQLAPPVGVAGGAPASWKESLRVLRWLGSTAAQEGGAYISKLLLPHLANLTVLHLGHLVVSERFCRALACLPHLGSLTLQDTLSPDSWPDPPPLSGRPLLPSLSNIVLDYCAGSAAALHILARWTNLPPEGVTLDCRGDVLSSTIATKYWSPGWMRAMFRQGRQMTDCGEHPEYPAGFLLADDEDVLTFRQAAAEFNLPLMLFLGQGIGAEAVRQLCSGQLVKELHVYDLAEEYMMPYVSGWEGPLDPTPDHFRAMMAATLRSFVLTRCQLLDDATIKGAAADSTLKDLTRLDLLSAPAISDQALQKLHSSCTSLSWLNLSGVQRISVAGLQPLLTTRGSLQRVEVSWAAGGDDINDMLADLLKLVPGITKDWLVATFEGADGILFLRKE